MIDWCGTTNQDKPVEDNDEQKQGSKAWHEFRSKHIGASEVPAMLGECDFKTTYDLYLEKIGEKEQFKGNFATRRGQEAEPEIRRLYEEKTGFSTIAPVLECQEFPILSASLDGWVEEEKLVVEFKYPSKEKHELARTGRVPKTYQLQIQAQMLCANAPRCDYVSYNGSDIVIVRVEADKEIQAKIVKTAKEFWNIVQNRSWNIEEQILSEDVALLCKDYIELKKQIDELEEKAETIKSSIKLIVGERSGKSGDYYVSFSDRKGAIDYSKAIELIGIDLEKYRKASTKVMTIKELKK